MPYDCGFAFVRDPLLLPKAFAAGAAYLPALDDPRPNLGYHSPEMSRRARSLAVWATLRAYGRAGHRAMIERHLALARTLGAVVEAAPDFELLAPVSLNIVCFRYAPPSLAGDEAALDQLNQELGQAVLDDGRVYVGTTRYDGRVAFRPAIVNWRTTEPDVRPDRRRHPRARRARRRGLSPFRRPGYDGRVPSKRATGPAFTVDFPTPLPAERRGEHWWMEAEGRELRLSNLNKVFWPDEGYTKGDLIAYYFNVADLILPYLRGRPLP